MGEVDITTNFRLIKYVPTKSHFIKIDLIDIFDAVITATSLQIDKSQLASVCENDLHIDLKTYDEKLIKVICEALIYYMTVWPGWQRYHEYKSGTLQRNDWVEKYQKYLNFKIHFVIKSAMQYRKQQFEKHKKVDEKTTQTTQELTTSMSNNYAPYVVTIGGPPTTLNNLVFKEHNNDILLKQHKGKDWVEISCQQFLNWPNVSVTVKLPDISITRKNTHIYNRFVGLKGDTMIVPDMEDIVHITKTTEVKQVDLKPYTYNFFSYYFLQLNDVLSKISNIKQNRLDEIKAIFKEYLKDLQEMNLYNMTMCSNIMIGYRIGRCRYVRNKKVTAASNNQERSSQRGVNFYEIITPQVDIALHHFNVHQDLHSQNHVSFQSLNALLYKIEGKSSHPDIASLHSFINNESITFSCTLCNENFGGIDAYSNITDHFRKIHKSEQAVLCYKCGKQFEIKFLAKKRWSHRCNSRI
ncbi:hypothetical protein FQA39_LY03656 [Lamprigera yunnana]|nr:hypothetical protein FQA39_LY03656 [Lamprigera yunnana]